MNLERPDLSQVTPAVQTYIEALEAELETLRKPTRKHSQPQVVDLPPLEPDEAPTTMNIITVSRDGLIKRTPRHLYGRQHRGGMGIFDLETPENDPPSLLTALDADAYMLCVTNEARTFRLRLNRLEEAQVRDRGKPLINYIPIHDSEYPQILLHEQKDGHVFVLTEKGHVRRFRYHYFGERLKPGLVLYKVRELGLPVAACWSDEKTDLLITTRQGKGIRFGEHLVPTRGCLGIRLSPGDVPTNIISVNDKSGIFLASADGKGTIRLMSGFSANKAPGSGGKVLIKTDHMIGATSVTDSDDIFIISQLSKMIRFPASEVPPKTGSVQGVNCMTLRADKCVAMTKSTVSDT